jgi:hypothetical protein
MRLVDGGGEGAREWEARKVRDKASLLIGSRNLSNKIINYIYIVN